VTLANDTGSARWRWRPRGVIYDRTVRGLGGEPAPASAWASCHGPPGETSDPRWRGSCRYPRRRYGPSWPKQEGPRTWSPSSRRTCRGDRGGVPQDILEFPGCASRSRTCARIPPQGVRHHLLATWGRPRPRIWSREQLSYLEPGDKSGQGRVEYTYDQYCGHQRPSGTVEVDPLGGPRRSSRRSTPAGNNWC